MPYETGIGKLMTIQEAWLAIFFTVYVPMVYFGRWLFRDEGFKHPWRVSAIVAAIATLGTLAVYCPFLFGIGW